MVSASSRIITLFCSVIGKIGCKNHWIKLYSSLHCLYRTVVLRPAFISCGAVDVFLTEAGGRLCCFAEVICQCLVCEPFHCGCYKVANGGCFHWVPAAASRQSWQPSSEGASGCLLSLQWDGLPNSLPSCVSFCLPYVGGAKLTGKLQMSCGLFPY